MVIGHRDDGTLPSVDVDTLRQAMGAWTTGVAVVTAAHADAREAAAIT